MLKQIKLGDKIIQYDLQYKKVKNINLRIKPDGTVNVSANRCVPQKVIEAFVFSRADFILRALDMYKTRTHIELTQYHSPEKIRDIILGICNEEYPYFEKMGIKYPQIKFRSMVSQWGNCRHKEGILTFNTNLIYAPEECIRYVVQHEFTHFLQPNHSAKFYSELSKICPQHKALRQKLKQIRLN